MKYVSWLVIAASLVLSSMGVFLLKRKGATSRSLLRSCNVSFARRCSGGEFSTRGLVFHAEAVGRCATLSWHRRAAQSSAG